MEGQRQEDALLRWRRVRSAEACSSVAGGGKLSPVALLNVTPCYSRSRETKQPEGEQVLQLDGLWRTAWPRCAVGHRADRSPRRSSAGAAGNAATFPAISPAAHLVQKSHSELLTGVFGEKGRVPLARCIGSVCALVWSQPRSYPQPVPLRRFLGSFCRQPRRQVKSTSLFLWKKLLWGNEDQKAAVAAMALAGTFSSHTHVLSLRLQEQPWGRGESRRDLLVHCTICSLLSRY